MAIDPKSDAKLPVRKDGRRPFMIYLDPALIKAVKRQALADDRHAYEVVEEILKEHLDAN